MILDRGRPPPTGLRVRPHPRSPAREGRLIATRLVLSRPILHTPDDSDPASRLAPRGPYFPPHQIAVRYFPHLTRWTPFAIHVGHSAIGACVHRALSNAVPPSPTSMGPFRSATEANPGSQNAGTWFAIPWSLAVGFLSAEMRLQSCVTNIRLAGYHDHAPKN